MTDVTDETKKLSKADEVFVSEYLLTFNATASYLKAHPKAKDTTAASNGWKLLRKTEIQKAITARLDEVHMSAEESLKLNSDIARAGLGMFFRISDEWTFYPLPTSEILDQKEVIDDTDPANPVKRICYRERRVILDMDKVLDPQYSRLIKKFSDTKNGLVIELYPADSAIERNLKVHGKLTNKVDVTSGGKELPTPIVQVYIPANSRNDR